MECFNYTTPVFVYTIPTFCPAFILRSSARFIWHSGRGQQKTYELVKGWEAPRESGAGVRRCKPAEGGARWHKTQVISRVPRQARNNMYVS